MTVIDVKLTDLKPYEKNPRHNQEAIKGVANSIREFGFKVPIVIDKNNVIVAGHTRYKASLELGLETVPCIVADDLTPKQIKAFRLADNKVSEKSYWDFDLLNQELEDIGVDIDMSLFDFKMDVPDSFHGDSEDEEDDIPDEVEVPKDDEGGATSIPSIKFGSTVIRLTEEECNRFSAFYDAYMNENGNAFGIIGELLDNGSRNYES